MLVALLCQGGIARAEGPAATLEPVVVLGTRVPTSLRQSSDGITVVTREEIDWMAPATGVDLFRQVPGLQVDQLGGPGGVGSVYIRGSDPNHVLVLVDGVRVNDPTTSRGGGFDLSGLDPSQIERIEVLRGAASSIYGADAMGGVINIVTRKGAQGFGASAGYGALGYRSARASVASGNARLSLSTLRDGRDTDGSSLALAQLGASTRFVAGDAGSITLDARHVKRKSSNFPDDSGGQLLAVYRALERHDGSETSLGARGSWDFDSWTVHVAATRYGRSEDIVSPGVAAGERNPLGVPSSIARTDFRRSGVLANAVRHLAGGSEVTAGGEYLQERGASQVLYELFGTSIPATFDLKRITRSGFVELKWLARTNLVVRAGLRRDAVSGNGARTSPSVGVRYDWPSIKASFKASFAEGFKPPSFFALGLPVALGGNPELRAERSKGGSIGYEQRFQDGTAFVSAALFKTAYTDLVTFDNEANRLVNAGRVDIRGVELEGSTFLGASVRLKAHFTRLLSHVAESDEPLRQRPGRRAGTDVQWSIDERSSLDWRIEYVAAVFDSSVPTGNVMLPTSVRHDVAYVLRFNRQFRSTLALDNVFDRQNFAYVGQPAAGRRVRLTLEMGF